MDRVEAIGVLTIEQAAHRKDGLVDRAIDMAIAALREQEQREYKTPEIKEKSVDTHGKLMGLLQRAPYIRCEDVHRQYAVNWLINNGVTVQEQSNANQRNYNASNTLEWISIKDDIPKCMKRYFIAYQFEGSDMRFYGEAMFHPEGGNGCVGRSHFSNEGVDGMYVTHWMEIPRLPLPEPPKGE